MRDASSKDAPLDADYSASPVSAPAEPTRGCPRQPVLWFVLLAFAVACYTAAAVQESWNQGRLARPPVYDDVSYLLDGARRVTSLYQQGFKAGVLRDYLINEPHSPFSSYLAAAGFLLFGFQEWAPYAMNGLLVLFMAGVVTWILRKQSVLLRVACLLVLAPMPMFIAAVQEFRPDIACAALMAAGIVLAIESPWPARPVRHGLLVGIIFGAALLTKPSFSVAALVAMAGVLGLTGFLDAWPGLKRHALAPGLKRSIAAGAGVLIVAGPHFFLYGRSILQYIWEAALAPQSSVWRLPLGRAANLRYYIDGAGGSHMLRKYPYLLIALVGAAAVSALVARERAEIRRWIALLTMLAGLYAISTVTPVKSAFFGLPFQVLLVMGGVMAIRSLHERSCHWPHGRRILTISLGAAIIAGIVGFKWPGVAGDNRGPVSSRHSPESIEARRIHAELADALTRSAGKANVNVFMTFEGDVNGPAIAWSALKNGTTLTVHTNAFATTPDEYASKLAWADLVVACDSGGGLAYEYLPSGKILDQVIAWLDAKPEWERTTRVALSKSDKFVYLYRKRSTAAN